MTSRSRTARSTASSTRATPRTTPALECRCRGRRRASDRCRPVLRRHSRGGRLIDLPRPRAVLSVAFESFARGGSFPTSSLRSHRVYEREISVRLAMMGADRFMVSPVQYSTPIEWRCRGCRHEKPATALVAGRS